MDRKGAATMPTMIHAMSCCPDGAGRDDQDQNAHGTPRCCLPEEIEHLVAPFRAFVAPNAYNSVSSCRHVIGDDETGSVNTLTGLDNTPRALA
jgi:hypothetical protein